MDLFYPTIPPLIPPAASRRAGSGFLIWSVERRIVEHDVVVGALRSIYRL